MRGGTHGAGLRAGTYAPVEGEGRGGGGAHHTWRMHVHVPR